VKSVQCRAQNDSQACRQVDVLDFPALTPDGF
jgi:hypothetical protein